MKKIVLVISVLVLFLAGTSSVVYAQGDGSQCQVDYEQLLLRLNDIVEQINDSNIDTGILGIEAIIAELEPCIPSTPEEPTINPEDLVDLFNAVATSNANVRRCPSTDCEIVGQTTVGQIFPVTGEEDDWYQIKIDGEIAYIASWLTSRGPDTYVEDMYEGYFDENTGCILQLTSDRGDNNLAVIITGTGLQNAWVDITRPNEAAPLTVDSQYDKTFIDTGDLYVLQTYYWGTWWPNGTYQVDVSFDGNTSAIAFDIDNSGDHKVWVVCNN